MTASISVTPRMSSGSDFKNPTRSISPCSQETSRLMPHGDPDKRSSAARSLSPSSSDPRRPEPRRQVRITESTSKCVVILCPTDLTPRTEAEQPGGAIAEWRSNAKLLWFRSFSWCHLPRSLAPASGGVIPGTREDQKDRRSPDDRNRNEELSLLRALRTENGASSLWSRYEMFS